jgi:hypothetical protein
MDDNMEVSGALRIKEEERIKKQTALSCTHLERNNGRLNGWMILKFELGISNTLMHSVSKLQLDPTVEL